MCTCIKRKGSKNSKDGQNHAANDSNGKILLDVLVCIYRNRKHVNWLKKHSCKLKKKRENTDQFISNLMTKQKIQNVFL